MQTNDKNNRSVTLKGTVRVMTALTCDPQTVNFGQIARTDEPQTKTITITKGDAGEIRPKLVPVKTANISAELREIEAGAKYELHVTLSPPWPNDSIRGAVTLETGIPQSPTERLRVFANLDPRLRSEPGSFEVPPNQTTETEWKARLVWSGRPGLATSVTSTDPRIQAHLDSQAGIQYVVIKVPADYSAESRRAAAVIVRTDDEAVSSVRIPVRVTASPRAMAAPSAAEGGRGVIRPAAEPGKAGSSTVNEVR